MAPGDPLPLDRARECVAGAVQPLDPIAVPLAGALGCVLRQNALVPEDMPPFDRSAMDGYAVFATREEGSSRFRVTGEVRPGVAPAVALHPGECVRIFTGAQIPQGATHVLKQEDVSVKEQWITSFTPLTDEFIRRRGEDARAGDRLLAPGIRLGPAQIALLASLGVVEPLVSPACRVVHFTTGDELVDPSEKDPGPSCIRDSNSALVRAFTQAHGGIIAHQERLPDDLDLLVEHARRATSAGCDLLLISGGASVGAYDFGRPTLRALGFEDRFSRLSLRPGRPLIFATRGPQAAFVLPGNPLSHLTVLHCIVRLAFERLLAAQPDWRILHATLRSGFSPGAGTETLWPARVFFENGDPIAEPLRRQSSGDITGLAGLNAYIRSTAPVLDTGARVACILVHG